MVALIKGFRSPAAPQWVETRIERGMWQLDHESGRYATIYRYAPGGAQSRYFTVPAGESLSSSRRTWYPSLVAAVRAVATVEG